MRVFTVSSRGFSISMHTTAIQFTLLAFTMGNATPIADLLVARLGSASRFLVDVKGQTTNNACLLKKKPEQKTCSTFRCAWATSEARIASSC